MANADKEDGGFADYDDIIDENAELRIEKAALLRKIIELQNHQPPTLTNLQKIVNDQAAQIIFLQRRLLKIQEELQDKKVEVLQLMPLRIECSGLKHESIQLKKVNYDLAEALNDCRAANTALGERLSILKEELADLQQKITRFNDLEIEIDNLKSRNEKLEIEVMSYASKNTAFEGQVQLLTSEIKHWKRKDVSLSKELAKVYNALGRDVDNSALQELYTPKKIVDRLRELHQENAALKSQLQLHGEVVLHALTKGKDDVLQHKSDDFDAVKLRQREKDKKSSCLSPKIFPVFACTKA